MTRPLVKQPRIKTLEEIEADEFKDTIALYVSEIAVLRRIREQSRDLEINEAITGIIQDELTIMHHYRRELL